MNLFLQLLGNGIAQGAVAMLYAAGFGFVYRSFRIFHIAMGAQFVFSCYAFYLFAVVAKLPLALAVGGGLALSVLFAAAIEWAVYRPFFRKGCSSGVVMIASLGVMIVVENLIALAFGNEVKTISTRLEPSVAFARLRFTRIQLLQFFVGIGVFVLVGGMVRFGKWFKAVWAMGDQPELIPVLGLPLLKLRLLVMALGGVLVAVAAMLVSWDIGMDPHVGMHYLLLGSVAVFFGGTDRYWAWGAGAMLLCILQSLAVWQFSARWTDLVTFGVLIFVLLFRPQGLFGVSKRLEEAK
ncbi:MAG: branched-chain amino acid ABC transporter permease [Kiritimatiellae bacterium]|nr:branched-chain amino acid ABC transporter permease [Kiritimatiellia bacterium]